MNGSRTGPQENAAIPLYVWILALVVLLLATVACGLWAFYTLRLQRPLAGPSPTPIIWTATPAPTMTPAPLPSDTPEPTPTASSEIVIGGYVQVSGTGGAGVSLRQEPDLNSTRLGIAQEEDVLIVLDGPRRSGGFTWWLVRDREEEAQQGWAVANYLHPVDHP
ncbi:MAG: SH3 domain-containing protein [Anaerolineae bacterium]|nr:SH3 domain-containing protein [Anaerolineae bacterium]